MWCLDDIQAEIMALRERGINAADVRAGSRKRPDGEELRWQMSMLDSGRHHPLEGAEPAGAIPAG